MCGCAWVYRYCDLIGDARLSCCLALRVDRFSSVDTYTCKCFTTHHWSTKIAFLHAPRCNFPPPASEFFHSGVDEWLIHMLAYDRSLLRKCGTLCRSDLACQPTLTDITGCHNNILTICHYNGSGARQQQFTKNTCACFIHEFSSKV